MEHKFPTELPDFHLNKTHRRLLRSAKRMIKDYSEDYVCAAIYRSGRHPEESGLTCIYGEGMRAVDDLTRFISRAIEKNVYFESWQHSKGINRTSAKIRKDRVKWINFILKNTPWVDD
jgi:hypothetical protein